jgi:hypothetical protein
LCHKLDSKKLFFRCKTMSLNSTYRFIEGSPLRPFILQKTKHCPDVFSLKELMYTLKNIIVQERLYDESNPAIILCSQEMETALDLFSLHCQQVEAVLCRHLTLVQSHVNLIPPETPDEPSTSTVVCLQSVSRKRSLDEGRCSFHDILWTIHDNFHAVLSTLPEFDFQTKTYRYSDIANYTSQYILSKRKTFFDKRNISVAHLNGDPLSHVFKVSAFHHDQIHSLIRGSISLFRS